MIMYIFFQNPKPTLDPREALAPPLNEIQSSYPLTIGYLAMAACMGSGYCTMYSNL